MIELRWKFKINGHKADFVDAGTGWLPYNLDKSGCGAYVEGENDWAILMTKGYAPFTNTGLSFDVELGDMAYFDNVNKDKLMSAEVVEFKQNGTFQLDMYAESGNSGAGVFNEDGELIGILVTHYRHPDRTGVVRLHRQMFKSVPFFLEDVATRARDMEDDDIRALPL